MSDSNNTNTINTSEYAHTAYTRNCQTYRSSNRSIFAVRARDIGRRLGFTSDRVSNDLGITSSTLTNFVRSRNQTDRKFDNIITSLTQAADYRTKTGKVHPSHRTLIYAVSTQYSTRVAAALGGISPSTASVWARSEKERISREWTTSFLDSITTVNENSSTPNTRNFSRHNKVSRTNR